MISGISEISGFGIRKARLADVDPIKALADEHRAELGFIVRSALTSAANRGEMIVAHDGSALAGFLEYHHRLDGRTTLYHIVVRPEYRGRGIGRGMVGALCREALSLGQNTIKLKCPIDLPANGFYERLGASFAQTETGKRRTLAVWYLDPAISPRDTQSRA